MSPPATLSEALERERDGAGKVRVFDGQLFWQPTGVVLIGESAGNNEGTNVVARCEVSGCGETPKMADGHLRCAVHFPAVVR